MRHFTMMLGILLFGFTIAFAILNEASNPELATTFWETILTAIFGAFEPDTYYKHERAGVMVAFFYVMMFIVNILMLNVLITIVGES